VVAPTDQLRLQPALESVGRHFEATYELWVKPRGKGTARPTAVSYFFGPAAMISSAMRSAITSGRPFSDFTRAMMPAIVS
jgi:hypothetical protein